MIPPNRYIPSQCHATITEYRVSRTNTAFGQTEVWEVSRTFPGWVVMKSNASEVVTNQVSLKREASVPLYTVMVRNLNYTWEFGAVQFGVQFMRRGLPTLRLRPVSGGIDPKNSAIYSIECEDISGQVVPPSSQG